MRRQMEAVIAELRTTHQQILDAEKAERAEQEKQKAVRKLCHHVLTVITAGILTWLSTKMDVGPLAAALAGLGPFVLQEAADFIKKV